MEKHIQNITLFWRSRWHQKIPNTTHIGLGFIYDFLAWLETRMGLLTILRYQEASRSLKASAKSNCT